MDPAGEYTDFDDSLEPHPIPPDAASGGKLTGKRRGTRGTNYYHDPLEFSPKQYFWNDERYVALKHHFAAKSRGLAKDKVALFRELLRQQPAWEVLSALIRELSFYTRSGLAGEALTPEEMYYAAELAITSLRDVYDAMSSVPTADSLRLTDNLLNDVKRVVLMDWSRLPSQDDTEAGAFNVAYEVLLAFFLSTARDDANPRQTVIKEIHRSVTRQRTDYGAVVQQVLFTPADATTVTAATRQNFEVICIHPDAAKHDTARTSRLLTGARAAGYPVRFTPQVEIFYAAPIDLVDAVRAAYSRNDEIDGGVVRFRFADLFNGKLRLNTTLVVRCVLDMTVLSLNRVYLWMSRVKTDDHLVQLAEIVRRSLPHMLIFLRNSPSGFGSLKPPECHHGLSVVVAATYSVEYFDALIRVTSADVAHVMMYVARCARGKQREFDVLSYDSLNVILAVTPIHWLGFVPSEDLTDDSPHATVSFGEMKWNVEDNCLRASETPADVDVAPADGVLSLEVATPDWDSFNHTVTSSDPRKIGGPISEQIYELKLAAKRATDWFFSEGRAMLPAVSASGFHSFVLLADVALRENNDVPFSLISGIYEALARLETRRKELLQRNIPAARSAGGRQSSGGTRQVASDHAGTAEEVDTNDDS